MTKFKYIVFVLSLLLLSCNSGNDKKSNTDKNSLENSISSQKHDSLDYKVVNITKIDKDCQAKRFKGCEIVNINYPIFKGQQALNDTVRNKTVRIYVPFPADSTIEQQADHFMKEYLAFKEEPYAAGRSYVLNARHQILQNDRLLSMSIESEIYTGGAHGGSLIEFINWDIEKGVPVTLNDVIMKEHTKLFLKVAESIFRKKAGLKPQQSLSDNYFFENNQFSLNDIYLFTPKGIKFIYNEYEIRAYAYGRTELFIPYETIKVIIKPKSLISNLFLEKDQVK